jgi:hypothetical protein
MENRLKITAGNIGERHNTQDKKNGFEVSTMKKVITFAIFILFVSFMIWGTGLTKDQDKYELQALNGISFSEVRGYETWQAIATSRRTDNNELRIILGNLTMINAYKEGIPGNGKPFPEGSAVVKIGWSEKQNPDFPVAFEPDVLKRVEFIIKDSHRFPDTNGWGYARFVYDVKTSAFTPYGKDSSFARECHQCHTAVQRKDFIFTSYPLR